MCVFVQSAGLLNLVGNFACYWYANPSAKSFPEAIKIRHMKGKCSGDSLSLPDSHDFVSLAQVKHILENLPC